MLPPLQFPLFSPSFPPFPVAPLALKTVFEFFTEILIYLFIFFLSVQGSTLFNTARDVCIDRESSSDNHASAKACTGQGSQVWEFSKTDDMDR